VGVVRDSRNFSGHAAIYWAHRAVVFAIAQLSCRTHYIVLLVTNALNVQESSDKLTKVVQ